MRVAVDTNMLVRVVMRDDREQARAAEALLRDAELVAIATPCLCEFAWVLRSAYGLRQSEVALAIRTLVSAHNVKVNRPVVDAGLRALEGGGDFADGAIAHEGRWLGGETFASFDRAAVALLASEGESARLP